MNPWRISPSADVIQPSCSHFLSATFTVAAEWKDPPDADVILRASGVREFHAHKLVLSLASSVFRDMFSVPQPSPTEPSQPSPTESSQLPIVDVNDPPEALEAFLQFIYPIPNPPIDDVETLASLISLADKYDAKAVLDAHKDYLQAMCFDSSPIHIYAILCACGREKEAEAVARRVPFASLTSLPDPLLHLMTVEHYQQLMRFMVARDQMMRQIVTQHREKIVNDSRYNRTTRDNECDDAVHRLYASTIVASLQAAFEEDPCVRVGEALGLASSDSLVFSPCGDHCRYNIRGLQAYAEGLLSDLVRMAETIPWES